MDIEPISPPSSTSLQKVRIFLLAIIVIGLVSGAIFYGRHKRDSKQERQEQEFSKNYQEGKNDVRALDAKAVGKLEQAVRTSITADDEASANLDLGSAYALLSKDPLKGLNILKEVTANTSYASRYRARAMLKILFTFIVQRMDLELARNNVFTGFAPWDTFTKGSKDMEEATRKAYEWTLQYGEWPSANYYIASWYGMRLLEGKIGAPALPVGLRDEYQKKFALYLQNGDKWLPDLLASFSNDLYEKVTIVNESGDLHALAYMLGGKEEEKKLTEQTFKQALEMIKGFSDAGYGDIYKESAIRSVQFSYAKLLAYDAVINHKKNLENQIHELVLPIIGAKNQSVNAIVFLKNVGALPKNHPVRWQTSHIAEADPEFASFLKNLGWSL